MAMFFPRGASVLYELMPLHRQNGLGAHKLIASMGMLKRSSRVEVFSKTEGKKSIIKCNDSYACIYGHFLLFQKSNSN